MSVLLTWYERMSVSWEVVRFPAALPMAARARFEGAKTVISLAVSRVSTRSAAVSAPASAVRPAATAAVDTLSGTVNTLSMMSIG